MAGIIRVLIVDDSALMREALKSIIEKDPAIEVVGLAKNGKEGVEKALLLKPDVITMDLKMPMMSGLEATEAIMEELPIPIIVVSSMDTTIIVKALSIGAMDFVAVTSDIDTIAADLIAKIKIASHVKPLKRMKLKQCGIKTPKEIFKKTTSKIVAIGISTGGPQALQHLLSRLPSDFPCGILVVQHMSKGFIDGLAEWLNATSSLHVNVAKAGDPIQKGAVMLAPDDLHMRIGNNGKIVLSENTNKTIVHVPSIDVMMKSVSDYFRENAIGVIMTGMGQDGVDGIRAIRKAGGRTIAQDEKTSVIFGMNKMAIDMGLIDSVIPLERMAEELIGMVQG